MLEAVEIYSQWTYVFVTFDFTLYIPYKITFLIFFIVKSFLNGF
jgi:hypothetical protein